MRVSVVLPTNRPYGPLYAIHSLANQSFSDFELIIVDDYHVDRSGELEAEAERLGLENLKVLRSKPNYWRSNRLIANARNTGLIHAEGGLVVFLDDFCWAPPKWLEQHWRTYDRTLYTVLGGMRATKYVPGNYDFVDMLPPPEVESIDSGHEGLMRREDDYGRESAVTRNLRLFKVSDTRGDKSIRDCHPGWFYSCNASAPLESLVAVNGFDEEYDLTSEEDIDLGLRLWRAGCRFWYRPEYDCTVFHVDHTLVDRETVNPKRYREVSYEELRRGGMLESRADEVQLVLKEKYGTKYDGSWGLLERNRRRGPFANIVDGVKIFDLAKERRKLEQEEEV